MKFRVEGIYDAKKLGIPQMLILGLQHMFAMFGATILVPILVNNYFHGEGLSIQVTLFCAGFGTLLFHVLTKLKVPAFLGSSFAFLGGFATVAELDTGIFANMSYGEKLPYACGGVFVAGLLYLVLAMIVKVIGVKRVMRYLPPVVTGPIIICIGLSLAPSAIKQRIPELDPCFDRTWNCYFLQHLGRWNVPYYSDSDGYCCFLCGCPDHECLGYDKRRWKCYPQLCRSSKCADRRCSEILPLQI